MTVLLMVTYVEADCVSVTNAAFSTKFHTLYDLSQVSSDIETYDKSATGLIVALITRLHSYIFLIILNEIK